MRIVLLGAPGSGKGTQAGHLSGRLAVPAISTGEIFRAERERRSPLGLAAAPFLDRGHLVPDDTTIAMVRHRIGEADAAAGFVLDGFPRTVDQAIVLDTMLGDARLDAVLDLVVPRDEIVRRLAARGRADDTRATVEARLDEYVAKTAPLIAFYREHGVLVSIDAVSPVEDITARILAALPQPGA